MDDRPFKTLKQLFAPSALLFAPLREISAFHAKAQKGTKAQ